VSDNPFENILNENDDPFAAMLTGTAKPKKGLAALGVPLYARDAVRSVASVPSDVARLLGAVGADTVGDWGNRTNEWLNENISPEARFDQEPGRAAIQLAAQALIPVPGLGLATAGAKMAPGIAKGIVQGTARGAELALPGTSPFTKGNVALNAGASIGLGVGVEELVDQAYPQQVPVPQPDRAVAPEIDTSPRVTVPSAQGQLAAAADDPFADIVNTAPEGNPYARFIVDQLPWALLLGGGAAITAAARRGMRRGAAADAANVQGLTQPGTPNTITSSNTMGEGLEAGIFNNLEVLSNRLNDAVKAGNITREQGDAQIATNFINLREAINNDRTAEFFNTGILDGTHRVQISPRSMLNEAALFTPEQRTKWSDLMAAADEHDVRQESLKRVGQPGSNIKLGPNGEPPRVALNDKSFAELKQYIADGRSDAAISAVEPAYRAIMNKALDYAVSEGTFGATEAAAMRAMGPNYMHRVVKDMTIQRNNGAGMPLSTGVEGNSPLNARSRAEDAGPLKMQDPALAMEDGIRQTLDFIHRNSAIRDFAKSTASNILDPTTGTYVPRGNDIRGVGRILPASARVADGYVGIKFNDGASKLQIELDQGLAAAVMPYPRTTVPIFNGLRILEQNATTGPVGALLGNVQAFVSIATSAATAAITAPSKLRAGYIDAAIRKMTGGTVNIRQLGITDPTFALQLVDSVVRDLGAHTAASLADTLSRSVNKNGYVAKMIGPQRAQDIANAMTRAYENSWTHYMRREGLLSQGIAYAADSRPTHTNIANLSAEYAQSMPYGGNAASIFDVRSKAQFDEWMAKTSNRATPPSLRRAWHFYSRALDLISNSPQSALFRANINHMAGKEKELLGLARTVVGDPAQYGGYKAVQAATSMLTYQNIAMQAAHQVFKSVEREPLATAARMGTLGSMLSLIMLHSAISSDEEALAEGRPANSVAHMVTRDANDAARSFRFYTGSENPEDSIRIPIDGALSPFFSAILAGLTEAFDVTNPEFYTDRYEPLRNSIETLLDDGTWSRIRAGIGVAGVDMSTPSLIRGAGQLFAGADMRNALSVASGPRINDTRDAPGYTQSSLNKDPINKYAATILETMVGLGGQTLLELMRTYGYSYEIKGNAGAMSAVAEQYGLTATSSGSSRILFGGNRRLRANDMVGDEVRKHEEKMQAISKDFSNVAGEGTIGNMSTARPSPYGAGKEGVPPDMIEPLAAFKDLYNKLSPLRDMRKMQSDEMRDAMSSPQLRSNPTQLRKVQNEHAMNIRSINASIYHHIDAMEKEQQARTGRAVRLQDLDPLKGLDQFAALE
jgi:hypothetical protein